MPAACSIGVSVPQLSKPLYQRLDDRRSGDLLVTAFSRMVKAAAGDAHERLSGAYMGLTKALRSFDLSRGLRFGTHARAWVSSEAGKGRAETREVVSGPTNITATSAQAAAKRLDVDFDANFEGACAAVASYTGKSAHEVGVAVVRTENPKAEIAAVRATVNARLSHVDNGGPTGVGCVYLDDTVGNGDDGDMTGKDLLADEAPSVEDTLIEAEVQGRMVALLDRLPEIERLVLQYRHLVDNPLALNQVAQVICAKLDGYGDTMSSETIRKKQMSAESRMKLMAADEGLMTLTTAERIALRKLVQNSKPRPVKVKTVIETVAEVAAEVVAAPVAEVAVEAPVAVAETVETVAVEAVEASVEQSVAEVAPVTVVPAQMSLFAEADLPIKENPRHRTGAIKAKRESPAPLPLFDGLPPAEETAAAPAATVEPEAPDIPDKVVCLDTARAAQKARRGPSPLPLFEWADAVVGTEPPEAVPWGATTSQRAARKVSRSALYVVDTTARLAA